MAIADQWSRLSTCNRGNVGCVVTDQEGFVVSNGYNGAPSGMDHCTHVGCYMEGDHCIRSIHAEMNAIITAARKGISLADTTVYTTKRPCLRCLTALAQAGVMAVIYRDEYDTDSQRDAAEWAVQMGIILAKY